MISNVLLTGYTAFLTDAFVAAAFPNSRILIAGKTQMQSSFSRKISVYTGALTREICQKFSQTYEFNQVVFFSHSIAPFRDIDGAELETLSQVLDICSLDTQVLYFAGPRHPPGAACAVLENAAQTLCRRFLPNRWGERSHLSLGVCPGCRAAYAASAVPARHAPA